jgi:dTDP-4-dehydrorhamnose 3,5-epimerase
MGYKFTDIGMGIILIENDKYIDERGFMAEWYNKEVLASKGITSDFNQHKASRSKKGVLRGFHFQMPPYSQEKIIRCISGKIFDVVVDIRKESKTFKKYVTINLSSDTNSALYVPKGFANAFVVLSDEDALILYYLNGAWMPEMESGIIWNDPELNIKWPVIPSVISKKDRSLPKLKDIVWQDG